MPIFVFVCLNEGVSVCVVGYLPVQVLVASFLAAH